VFINVPSLFKIGVIVNLEGSKVVNAPTARPVFPSKVNEAEKTSPNAL